MRREIICCKQWILLIQHEDESLWGFRIFVANVCASRVDLLYYLMHCACDALHAQRIRRSPTVRCWCSRMRHTAPKSIRIHCPRQLTIQYLLYLTLTFSNSQNYNVDTIREKRIQWLIRSNFQFTKLQIRCAVYLYKYSVHQINPESDQIAHSLRSKLYSVYKLMRFDSFMAKCNSQSGEYGVRVCMSTARAHLRQ